MNIKNYEVKGNKVKFSCPKCKERLVTKLKQAGTNDYCPECGIVFTCAGQKELHQQNSDIQKQKDKKLQEQENEARDRENRQAMKDAEEDRLTVRLVNKERELGEVDAFLHRSGYYRDMERKREAESIINDNSITADQNYGCLLILLFCSIILIPIALLMLWSMDNAREQAKKTRRTMILTSGVMDITVTPEIEKALEKRNELQAEIRAIKSEIRKLKFKFNV